MAQDLEARLKGTRWGHVTLEFFTNSAHFPIANLFLELLKEGPAIFLKPDVYTIALAALVQAVYLGTREYEGRPRPLIGNLIGPLIYTVIEMSLEGRVFFATGNHVAYLSFGLIIGMLQEARLHAAGWVGSALLVGENIVRVSIILVMYWIFEAADSPKYASFAGFVSDGSHVFIILALIFLGSMLGLAKVNAQAYLSILRETAHQLKRYSEWFLGKDILHSAVADPSALSIQRRERTVLFMDIRGFTGWSETRRPEEVVDMLNEFFERSENIWERFNAIKTKFTGDEIMLVFAAEKDAALAGLGLIRENAPHLRKFGLAAGIGIHTGVLVEGLIGSKEVKGYDVIGDTVNTAKRICDNAAGGELLVSGGVLRALGERAVIQRSQQISMKGKTEPIEVYSLEDVR